MKYNLKNRPKPKFDVGSPYCGGWLMAYTEWFEGFQKELEEIHPKAYERWGVYAIRLKKEILGE